MILELAAFVALAEQCAPQVAPETLTAIVSVESRFNPYAIGVNRAAGLSRQPTSAPEAVRVARQLIAQGRNIDLGLGQINSANLEWLDLSIEDAFDPCKNLSAAARVLQGGYSTASRQTTNPQQALRVALSLYNIGNSSRGFRNGYVRKVENEARRLVPAIATGPNASGPADTVLLTASRSSDGDAPIIIPAELEDAIASATQALAEPPASWDVFGQSRSSTVMVFGGRP